MSTITPEQQSAVEVAALDYEARKQYRELSSLGLLNLDGVKSALRLERERGDRLQKAILEAVMWLSVGQTDKAQQTLNRALTA